MIHSYIREMRMFFGMVLRITSVTDQFLFPIIFARLFKLIATRTVYKDTENIYERSPIFYPTSSVLLNKIYYFVPILCRNTSILTTSVDHREKGQQIYRGYHGQDYAS
uniref:Secreted protein n=1 Tax=Heterorhabditis bacteriophora TaxID=37862 RepID=A0A1I7W967_HETBA